MGFEVFEPQAPTGRTAIATVRFLSQGRVHFNAAAARLLEGVTHIRLLFDEDTDRIGFEPTDEGDALGYKITRAPSQAIFNAAGFALQHNLSSMKTVVEREGDIFVTQAKHVLPPDERRAVVL